MAKATPELTLLLAEAAPTRQTHIVDIQPDPKEMPPYERLGDLKGALITKFATEPAVFDELRAANKAQTSCHNLAIGDGKMRKMHFYVVQSMTALFSPYVPVMRAFGWLRQTQIRNTAMTDLVALDDLPDLAPFDMMKIAQQGGEKLAFKGAKRMLTEAVCVIVELRYLPLYQRAPLMGGIDTALRRQGFDLHKFMSQKARMLQHSQSSRVKRRLMPDQVIAGNAVYVRNMFEPEKLSDDQLKHLAILACAVFNSHSLVIYLLDELARRGAVAANLPARYVDALPATLHKD